MSEPQVTQCEVDLRIFRHISVSQIQLLLGEWKIAAVQGLQARVVGVERPKRGFLFWDRNQRCAPRQESAIKSKAFVITRKTGVPKLPQAKSGEQEQPWHSSHAVSFCNEYGHE